MAVDSLQNYRNHLNLGHIPTHFSLLNFLPLHGCPSNPDKKMKKKKKRIKSWKTLQTLPVISKHKHSTRKSTKRTNQNCQHVTNKRWRRQSATKRETHKHLTARAGVERDSSLVRTEPPFIHVDAKWTRSCVFSPSCSWRCLACQGKVLFSCSTGVTRFACGCLTVGGHQARRVQVCYSEQQQQKVFLFLSNDTRSFYCWTTPLCRELIRR